MAGETTGGWPAETRNLLRVAVALFAITTIIGILNGLDLVDFDRNQILTHVHSGTLGWITLGIAAAAFWLLRAAATALAWALGISVPVYVAAFYLGSLPARAITGVVLMAVIVWLLAWAWRAWLADRTLPGLGVVLGLTTFFYGAVIGVVLQVQLATGTQLFPTGGDVIGAHASAMVFSFVVSCAMGIIEWRAIGARPLSAAGVVQYGALFAGGAVISATLLFLPDAVQPAGGVYLLLQLVAVAIFAVRILPRTLGTDWTDASAGRLLAASSAFVLVAMAIFLAVIAMVISNPQADINFDMIAASDHAAFVGVMTNLLFALALVPGGRATGAGMADQLVFWAMNAGLILFLIGLVGDVRILIQVGAPLMGVAILLGLVLLAMRLPGATLAPVER